MRLTFCSGGVRGRAVTLAPPRMRIGRAKDCEIAVGPDDATVSATHAVLENSGGAWTLRDVGSRTGTFLNGRRIESPIGLRPGDWILFGASGVLARFEDDAAAPLRSFMAVEPEGQPGVFMAFADVDAAEFGGLRFRLDRLPAAVEVGDARQPVSPGDVVRRAPGAPGVRVLAVQALPGAAAMGPESLQRLVSGEVRRKTSAAWAVAAVLVAAAALAAYFVIDSMKRRERDLKADVDAERARTAETMASLQKRFAKTAAAQREDFEAELQRQKAEMQKELAKLKQSERDRFSEWFEKYKPSILLIYCELVFPDLPNAKTKEPMRLGGYGTGWVVSRDGRVVTNKHVVQSYKFDPEIQAFLEAHPATKLETVIYAWPGGERFLEASGEPNAETGFNTHHRKNLRLIAVDADEWEPKTIHGADGKEIKTRSHALTAADLAVLKIDGGPFVPLPVKSDLSSMKELDAVMVLGFPLGANILDSGRADVSASLGTLRFITKDVAHTAPQFPGNSGGPLIALDGEVIGVNSKGLGRGEIETMGRSIRSDDLQRFLRTVK